MSNSKPQKALKLGLNVLIDSSCEGENCRHHDFPYTFNSIVGEDNFAEITIRNTDDIWDYIKLLLRESQEHQKEGSSFSDLNNIWEQLPFFMCINHLLDSECQKDINRYIYSKETNTQPYRGAYGDQPSIWIQKYFIIKTAMNLRNEKIIKSQEIKNGNK